MRELPNEEHANRLLDWFFSKVNYVRYPIDEYMFRKCAWQAGRAVANFSVCGAVPIKKHQPSLSPLSTPRVHRIFNLNPSRSGCLGSIRGRQADFEPPILLEL